MLVFIDESDDPGFKLIEGSSSHFVMAMVIFETDEDAADADRLIQGLKKQLGISKEFKFNKSREEIRDEFFSGTSKLNFKVRAIVVDKARIQSERLKRDKEKFYEFFARMMMQYDGNRLENARIIIDGSGDRSFKRRLQTYLKRHLDNGAVKSIRFKDSHRDSLVQLADMCAGAIARSYKVDRTNARRWRNMLRNKIDDIWDFK
jgi:hypothetical protein